MHPNFLLIFFIIFIFQWFFKIFNIFALYKHYKTTFVATLALGSRPKQGLTKVWAKWEGWESHFMFLGVWESVKEWTPTLPNELPLWKLESQWIPESSESDCKGQNPLDWKVLCIGNLLEPICLKWACITHLDISNTSYGQKKGRESNWQFDSRPLKV